MACNCCTGRRRGRNAGKSRPCPRAASGNGRTKGPRTLPIHRARMAPPPIPRDRVSAWHGLNTSLTLLHFRSSMFSGHETGAFDFNFLTKSPKHGLVRAFGEKVEISLELNEIALLSTNSVSDVLRQCTFPGETSGRGGRSRPRREPTNREAPPVSLSPMIRPPSRPSFTAFSRPAQLSAGSSIRREELRESHTSSSCPRKSGTRVARPSEKEICAPFPLTLRFLQLVFCWRVFIVLGQTKVG